MAVHPSSPSDHQEWPASVPAQPDRDDDGDPAGDADQEGGEDPGTRLRALPAPPATSTSATSATSATSGPPSRSEPPAAGPAPATRPGRRALAARQVERIVRRVNLWSVARVSVVFYLCLWAVLTVAGILLWQAAGSAGAIDNVESFLAELFVDEPGSFVIDGREILWASGLAGLILVVAGTGLTVLLAVLFNLISDLTGGIRVSVVELETARPAGADPGSGSPGADRVR